MVNLGTGYDGTGAEAVTTDSDHDPEFEWDDAKAATNLERHRVSFEEATSVFFDPLARIFDDPIHSQLEQREIVIAHSSADRLLLVCFTERRHRLIRIFSARPATKRERRDYEENTA